MTNKNKRFVSCYIIFLLILEVPLMNVVLFPGISLLILKILCFYLSNKY